MKKTVLLAVFFLLAACSDATPRSVQAQADSAPVIQLDVLTIDIEDLSGPLSQDYVINNFQPTIPAAVHKWLTQKFVAVGSTGTAAITIRDASFTAKPLPFTEDMFTRKQALRYDAHAEVNIDIAAGDKHANVTAETARYETLMEKPTDIERHDAYTNLVSALMNSLSASVKTGADAHLGLFVVTAPVDRNTAPLYPAQ